MTKRIWNDWNTQEEITDAFNATWPEGAELLFADYNIDGYEGSAFVLYRLDGKLYEVYGSHCSCYGLEDQWEPEESLLEELLARQEKVVNDPRERWQGDVTEADRALLSILRELAGEVA